MVIEFTIYNANLNIFAVSRLGIEIPASGQPVPFYSTNNIAALRYETSKDYVMLALEILIIIYFSIEYLYLEIYEMSVLRRKYFRELWNYYELLLIAVRRYWIFFAN